MKKILPLIAAAALFATGCTTTQTGSKTVDPAILRLVAQEAAAVGSTVWLQGHPNDREAFTLARTSLRALIATGTGSPADLQAALASLPISQLQGSGGAVIVSGAVVLLDAAGRQLTALDSKQIWSGYVLPVAQGLEAGLSQGLGAP